MMIIPGFRVFTSPGELNPEALARVELRESTGEMCVTMRTVEVEPPITVHLHQHGEDGPVVATFFDQITDLNPQGCATVGADVVRDIQRNGFSYALGIHSAGIPGYGSITGPVAGSPSPDAFLTPEAVTSGPGDPDGTGIISLFVSEKSGEISFFVNTEGLTSPLTVELHQGAVGEDGPVVATPAEGATHDDPSGRFFVERSLARDLKANPGSYYILVRSADFPDGALRGRLEQ